MNNNPNTIDFIPRVYDKKASDSVLDRTFKEFGRKEEPVEKTIEQFFLDYEELYWLIPSEGETGSHQYLVEKSSQLYQPAKELEDIQPLLNEITLLRSQSIQDQKQIIELTQQVAELSATVK